MSISMIIHVLEASCGLLLALLGVQVARQYRIATKKQGDEHVKIKQSIDSEEIIVDRFSRSVDSNAPSKPESAPISEPSNTTASQILDDYIGGFFDDVEPAQNEIKAFRSADVSETSNFIDAAAENDHVEAIAPAVDLASYKVNPLKEESIPTLHRPIPESMMTAKFLQQVKELDEEVILVEGDDEPSMANPVMSDKVVLAMLDEAKLVSSH